MLQPHSVERKSTSIQKRLEKKSDYVARKPSSLALYVSIFRKNILRRSLMSQQAEFESISIKYD